MECHSQLHQLASHNPDIQKLIDHRYAIAFDGGYLIVRDVPYLDANRKLQFGAIVTKVVDVDTHRIRQEDHQVFFAGSAPYGLDGKPIPNLGGGATTLALSEVSRDIVVQRSFSNKPLPSGAFADFFEKIESYVGIISGPAIELHGATPYTGRIVEDIPESVFKVHDTLTSRAEITDLSAKFKDDVVAIFGLGGTGSYLLDLLIKTAIREVRAFDHDAFHVHTAFRSPGKLDLSEFGRSKAEVYRTRYENFRKGLVVEHQFVDASKPELMEGVTFAFVCVDKGSSRSGIFDLLIERGIPFIDVGMGLYREGEPLNGMVRLTYYSVEDARRLRDAALAEMADPPDDIYRNNIQIGELNALNACLAVIKFKQIRGFYATKTPYYHLLMEIGDLKTVGESNQ